MKLIKPLFCVLVTLTLSLQMACARQSDGPVRVTEWVQDGEAIEDWGALLNEKLPQLASGSVIEFGGRRDYPVRTVIELHQSVQFLLGAGARLYGEGIESLIEIKDGTHFQFEGLGGRAELMLEDRPHTAVINLNRGRPGIQPDLIIRNLKITGHRGIYGMHQPDLSVPRHRYLEDAAGLGNFIVENCHFEASDIHIGHSQATIDSVRVENSLFTGDVRHSILIASPVPNGVIVRGNRVLNAGIRGIQIGGGAATQIDDGAVNYVSSVIVHDNQILGGGHRAAWNTAYILGIIVYGNSVSIQGNIVRDFNRGEPVPGERAGHHFPVEDGSFHRGPWIPDDTLPRGQRRLAGAAIYAKARYGMIANNICTNSGWRSVIEVKTGGREPYFLVANNIVDGKSLAIEDSFGFEPNVARALWVNNVVSDMPYMAFKVSNRMESAYINNVIYDSKIGFRVSNTVTPNPELILNNYFVNVEVPVEGLSPQQFTARVSPSSPIIVESLAALPKPGAENRGQLAFVQGADTDSLYISRATEGAYAWHAIPLDGAPVQATGQFPVTGENLVLNPLQDRDSATDAERGQWGESGQYSQQPYGWQATINVEGLGAEQVFVYENATGPSGTRVLRAGGEGLPNLNWLLQQQLHLEPGKTYRARAVVRRNNRDNRLTLILQNGEERQSSRIGQVDQWETLEVNFTVPTDADPLSRLRLYSTGAGDGRTVWIDEVSLYELATP